MARAAGRLTPPGIALTAASETQSSCESCGRLTPPGIALTAAAGVTRQMMPGTIRLTPPGIALTAAVIRPLSEPPAHSASRPPESR